MLNSKELNMTTQTKYYKSTFNGKSSYRSTKRNYQVAMWATVTYTDGDFAGQTFNHCLSFNSKPLTKGAALGWQFFKNDTRYDYNAIKVFPVPLEEVTKEEFKARDDLNWYK